MEGRERERREGEGGRERERREVEGGREGERKDREREEGGRELLIDWCSLWGGGGCV